MLSPVEDDRCHGVEHFFGGCVSSSFSLTTPLRCGKSMANTLKCPDAASGSKMATTSPCMTSRMFADTTRNSSRSSRFDVIRFVRFRSNCSRSFCRCNSACASCSFLRLRRSLMANATRRAINRRKPMSSVLYVVPRGWRYPVCPVAGVASSREHEQLSRSRRPFLQPAASGAAIFRPCSSH